MPDSISSCGELNAPPLSITCVQQCSKDRALALTLVLAINSVVPVDSLVSRQEFALASQHLCGPSSATAPLTHWVSECQPAVPQT